MISFRLFFEEYNSSLVMAPSKDLGLENSLYALPIDEVPYGFWVNKFGHFVPVNRLNHAAVATKIIDSFNRINPENPISLYGSNGGPMKQLYNNGFIRIVSETHPIYWEHPNTEFNPSQSQQKFLTHLSQTYRKPIKRDTQGESF